MTDQLPEAIQGCIRKSAKRFGDSLAILNWPNGGKDAPPHEANIIINLSFFLAGMDPTFHLYAEGTVNENCRVDLIGFNDSIAIAVEAKGFGHINHRATDALADLNRLRGFRPSLSDVRGNTTAQEWWDNATHRWGIILIASFRGKEVQDAWMTADTAVAKERLSTYPTSQRATDKEGNALGFLNLLGELPLEYRRSEKITSGEQWGSGEGWLLWAGFPL